MKILVFLLVSFIFSSSTYASAYFDFTSRDYLVDYDGSTIVNLYYDLVDYSEDNFRVRPVSSSASVFIYSTEAEEWIKSNDSWLEMPILSKKIKIKINSHKPANVNFEIQNIQTSTIYPTNEKKYYPYVYLQKNFRDPVLTIPIHIETEQIRPNKVIKYINGFLEKI